MRLEKDLQQTVSLVKLTKKIHLPALVFQDIMKLIPNAMNIQPDVRNVPPKQAVKLMLMLFVELQPLVHVLMDFSMPE